MNRFRRFLVVACTAVIAAGIVPAVTAQADCNSPGDFGASSGCAPPSDSDSSDSKTQSWPPTAVDWPPSIASTAGESKKPIVMPDGMVGTHDTATTSTTPQPPPIVPVGSPSGTGSTDTTATPIVVPTHG